jgi:hypothetical protein
MFTDELTNYSECYLNQHGANPQLSGQQLSQGAIIYPLYVVQSATTSYYFLHAVEIIGETER